MRISRFLVSVSALTALGVLAAPGGPAPGERARSALDPAWKLLRSGDAEAAAERFERRLAERDDDEEAIEGQVRALLAQDRWSEALAVARSADARRDFRPRVVSALAEALFRAGRFEEAHRRLASHEPWEHSRALWTQSRLLGAEGRVEQAARKIERAIELDPTDGELHLWAAELAPTREESLAHLDRFLELDPGVDPDRSEAVRGTARLYRELGERAVWVPESRPARVELPLRAIWDDRGRRLGYVIEARVGPKAKPVRLLLDTGSTGLYLVARVARKRGFVPVSSGTTFGGGGDRRHRSERGLLDPFTLGGLCYRDALVTTTRSELEPHGRFHGVIGLSVFGGYRVTIDPEGGRLLLEPGVEGAEGDPYWTVAAQMLVRVASASGDSGLFLFDTGASWSVVSRAFVESDPGARLGAPAEVRGFGGVVEGARFVEELELSFQGLTAGAQLRAVDLSLRSRLTGTEVSGYLGLDLLGDRRIVVDTVARRIQVVPR